MRKLMIIAAIMVMASFAMAQVIDVAITPDSINVPFQGGFVNFTVSVTNTTTSPQSFQAWMTIDTPLAPPFTFVFPVQLTLPGGYTGSHTFQIFMPPPAPPGNYIITALVGTYPNTIIDQATLTVIKSAPGAGPANDKITLISGDLNFGSGQAIPVGFSLTAAPNPFNPATTLNYSLPGAAIVNLSVYDLSGRLVTTLAEGLQEAGSHRVTFDGSNLASGIYLYRLEAGSQVLSGKLALMK